MLQKTPSAAAELASVDLGDRRREGRAVEIVAALEAHPDASFPKALGSDSAAEAAYRFVRNPRVDWKEVLRAHSTATWQRASSEEMVFVVHDSTLFQFSSTEPRNGLFRTTRGKSGYVAHVALAVGADGSRLPLGVVGMIPVVRPEPGARNQGPGTAYNNEAERWHDLFASVEAERPAGTRVVHIMDREADNFSLVDLMHFAGAEFVIRVGQDRSVLVRGADAPCRMSQILGQTALHLERTVQISRRDQQDRPPDQRRSHPGRDERMATLEIRAIRVEVKRPKDATDFAPTVPVNLVYAVEKHPPEGEAPVSWLLMTSLPISTAAEVAAVVDAYRARWLIEEYFKSLKTGCAYQDRQLESLNALLVAFGLLAPVAWKLLALRWLARNDPKRPASEIFTDSELDCLRSLATRPKDRLPRKPTVNQAMMAIARLGGFLTQNKVPGWQVIGRGFQKFQDIHAGYVLARTWGQAGGSTM